MGLVHEHRGEVDPHSLVDCNGSAEGIEFSQGLSARELSGWEILRVET